jgi:hypothetical protein
MPRRNRPPLHAGSSTATEDLIGKPMDDAELKASLPPGIKIVRYLNLKKYRTIYDLLPRARDAAIILYEAQPQNGHWCAVGRNEHGLFFFDPYGDKPDKQLSYSRFSRNRVLGAGDKSISDLFATYKDQANIHYNPHNYQIESPDINTCGRHCVMFIRSIMEGGDLDDYYTVISNAQKKTGMNADELSAKAVPTDLPDI